MANKLKSSRPNVHGRASMDLKDLTTHNNFIFKNNEKKNDLKLSQTFKNTNSLNLKYFGSNINSLKNSLYLANNNEIKLQQLTEKSTMKYKDISSASNTNLIDDSELGVHFISKRKKNTSSNFFNNSRCNKSSSLRSINLKQSTSEYEQITSPEDIHFTQVFLNQQKKIGMFNFDKDINEEDIDELDKFLITSSQTNNK
jgi:hypothetical protein